MSNSMQNAAENLGKLAVIHGTHEFIGNNRSTINHLLQKIGRMAEKLFRCHEENMKLIRNLRHPVHDLLDKLLSSDKHIQHPNTVVHQNVVTVPIPASRMLQELLSAIRLPLPEYELTRCHDNKIIAACVFYASETALTHLCSETVYGSPSLDNHDANESAASMALAHMDTEFHMHLIDYNYESKEREIDSNRTLLSMKKRLTMAMIDTYNFWRCQSTYKLCSAIDATQEIIDIALPADSTQEITDVLATIMDSTNNILFYLNESYNAAMEIIERYDAIKEITTKMYSRIP